MSNISDEKLTVNALVRIDGEELKFVSLVIDQSYGEHHTFSIKFDYDEIDKNFMNNPVKHMELISKLVTIEIQQGNDNGNAYVFKGVITNVKMTGNEGKHGFLILEGKSPTIMLEQGKRMDVFSKMSLKKVVTDVTSSVYNDYLTCLIKPAYEGEIEFLMQYKESDWEFLQRLSSLYGESFFFSGSELLFGEYDEWKTESLMYDREIINYQLCSRLLPNTFTNYHYLADQDYTIESNSSEDIAGSNTFVQKAFERSKDLTQEKPVFVPSDTVIGDPGELKEIVIRKKTATAASTIVFIGEAKTCHPRIGRIFEISLPESMTSRNELGTFRVIKVRHIIDQNHRYRNEFEAVPAKLKYMPVPELKMPIADSVRAIIINNNDPENLGRVQVDFPFSQEHHSEIWLRVMSPDAGGLVGHGDSKSGDIERNRGMVFIPEEGDQVMIGFEMGDPNRPYVMGSLFHGSNSSGAAQKNTVKTIMTRTGHTVEFNDDENSLGITIKDKNGNIIHLDTKDKNINITAPEKININAKEININGTDHVLITSDKLIREESKKDIEIEASTGVMIEGKSKVNVDSKVIEQNANKITASAKSKVEIDGANVDISAKTVANIKGMPLNLN